MRRRNVGSDDAPVRDGDGDGEDDDDWTMRPKPKSNRKFKVPIRPKGGSGTGLPPLLALWWVATLTALARWSVLFNVPAPVGIGAADQSRFSEERVLTHARDLAEGIGPRVVSTPAMEPAEWYVVDRARELVEEISAARADDMDVDLSIHRPTGSFRLNFLNNDIANAYTNLTNVVVRVAPKDASIDAKSVLLNAHFDTTLGSPGGADCASCVGMLLEILRVMARPGTRVPAAPVLFLFNGGEETFMQAAHGFVAHHPWAKTVGAVINIEATGTSGPDVLFRETGGWPAEVYMRTAPRPAATASIRDLVRFANLPVDTDFSVFRDPTLANGNLPGVDIASMLDGYSYHTDRDLAGRIRRGTIQAYGENVHEAMFAFARELQSMPATGSGDASSAREPVRPGAGTTFFDLYGALGVTLGTRPVAMAVQFVPLLACVVDAVVRGSSYRRGAAAAAKSWGLAAALPAALGASRAVVTGRPLVWFGKPLVTLAFYLLPSLTAVLMPYAKDRNMGAVDGARGAALVTAFVAALAGLFSAASGYMFAAWSACITVTVLVIEAMPGLNAAGWATVPLLFTAPAAFLAAPVSYVTFTLISEKVGIAGSEPWPFGLPISDAVMGLATGLLTSLSFCGLAPFMATRTRLTRSTRRVRFAMFTIWTVVAVVITFGCEPYSNFTPKRLAVLHQHDANVANTDDAVTFLVGAFDSVPAANALQTLHRASVVRPTTREDFGSMHPVTQLLGEGVVLSSSCARSPPWSTNEPTLRMSVIEEEEKEDEESWGASKTEMSPTVRIEVEMNSRYPAWSCTRVTGPVVAWSLSEELPVATGAGDGQHRWARHAGNGVASEVWKFWVDVRAGDESKVALDAWSLYPGESEETREITDGLASYISSIVGTTYRYRTAAAK
jgi:hypothetical protein